MKTARLRLALLTSLTAMSLALSAASPAENASGMELEVIGAMATILNKDTSGSYDYLFFESDFSASANVASSLANPDRTQFCGLTREQAQSVVAELEAASNQPVEFDKLTATQAGLKIGHKRRNRSRYLMLSRVVFAPDNLRAWVAVDLNGETGALMQLDKVNGQWNKTHRCGGWVVAE
jgi:hypothetical protein